MILMLSLFITLPIRTKTLERHAIPSHNFFCQIAIPSLDLKRYQIQGNELHRMVSQFQGTDFTIRYNELLSRLLLSP